MVQTEKVRIKVETLAEGLDRPWSVEPLPDGTLLITERTGHLSVYRDGKLTRVKGLPKLYADVQGGLLDAAPSPDGGWDVLAVAQVEALRKRDLRLASPEGPVLRILTHPAADAA